MTQHVGIVEVPIPVRVEQPHRPVLLALRLGNLDEAENFSSVSSSRTPKIVRACRTRPTWVAASDLVGNVTGAPERPVSHHPESHTAYPPRPR